MKWKLSDWASIAEIIAAIGVIFSLIFVGLQINEGNLETRAATNQATADAEAFMIVTFANHSYTWNKVITGAPLESGAESRKGILLYNLLMCTLRINIVNSNLDFLMLGHGRAINRIFSRWCGYLFTRHGDSRLAPKVTRSSS